MYMRGWTKLNCPESEEPAAPQSGHLGKQEPISGLRLAPCPSLPKCISPFSAIDTQGRHCLSVCFSAYLGISLKDHIVGPPSLPWSEDSLGILALQFELLLPQSLPQAIGTGGRQRGSDGYISELLHTNLSSISGCHSSFLPHWAILRTDEVMCFKWPEEPWRQGASAQSTSLPPSSTRSRY